MKLYVSERAPNPRRVQMFIAEKGITGIEEVLVDINAHEHLQHPALSRGPMARIPVLELDDGRILSESRAICTWLEGQYPEPNLMGRDADERAFIEMSDRQVEWCSTLPLAQAIRHQHPPGGAGATPVPGLRRVAAGESDGIVALAGGAVATPALGGGRALHHRRHHRVLHRRVCAPAQAQARRGGLPAVQAWRDRVAAR